MSDIRPSANQTARKKAASAFNDRAQQQITADTKRVEEQAVAHRRMVAKTESLRAQRMERDALLAKEAAEEKAAAAAAAPKKRVRATSTATSA